VRTMIKVNAAMNAQFLKRECGSATSSHPSVDPVRCVIARQAVGLQQRDLRLVDLDYEVVPLRID
jgi:hypothetical protein